MTNHERARAYLRRFASEGPHGWIDREAPALEKLLDEVQAERANEEERMRDPNAKTIVNTALTEELLARRRTSDARVHASSGIPFRPRCGADVPNSKTTYDADQVTCEECLRPTEAVTSYALPAGVDPILVLKALGRHMVDDHTSSWTTAAGEDGDGPGVTILVEEARQGADYPRRAGVPASAHREEYMRHAKAFVEAYAVDIDDEEDREDVECELESMLAKAYADGYDARGPRTETAAVNCTCAHRFGHFSHCTSVTRAVPG